MEHHHISHIPIYEGDKDPMHDWFIYKTIWYATDVTNKANKIS